jgi:hypothetical protein
MAIATVTTGNNGADNGGATSSVSWSFDAKGGGGSSDYALFVQIEGDTSTDDVTGCTYNGVAGTLIDKAQATGGRWTYLFRWIEALSQTIASGSNTIQASASSTHYLFGCAVSYSGVGSIGATAKDQTSSSQTSLTQSVTTTTANSWVVTGASGSLGVAAGTSATLRAKYAAFSSPGLFDSNGTVSVGSNSMTINSDGAAAALAMVMAEVKEATAGSSPTPGVGALTITGPAVGLGFTFCMPDEL